MPRATLSSGIELEYETFGDPMDPTLLLVCGHTSQMPTGWDGGLCARLVEQGLHVVRFDNRDVGLSTKLEGVINPMKVVAAMIAGEETPPVPYLLSDMAADGIGLLDHLGVERAHVAGMSMGGMIVQTMAIEHPDRVISLTSIMSTTGDPSVGQAAPEARDALLAPPPMDREAYIEASSRYAVWASKRHRDLDKMRERAARDFDRSFYPQGATRQLAAIYASGDRTEGLRSLDVPTAVTTPSSSRPVEKRPQRRSPDRSTCCSPTWATTCPSRCGPCSPKSSAATPEPPPDTTHFVPDSLCA